MEDYAKQGLRTLLVASRELEEEFYNEWNQQYKDAMISANREEETN